MNISSSTIDRFLKKIPIFYENYFIIDFSKKQIRLRNCFKGMTHSRFITLSDGTFHMLVSLNDDLLCKYYCFLRFECGKHPNGTDRTAKQILEAMGYSSKSGNYQSRLSEYNRILTASQLIKINKQRDRNGNERNIYHL